MNSIGSIASVAFGLGLLAVSGCSSSDEDRARGRSRNSAEETHSTISSTTVGPSASTSASAPAKDRSPFAGKWRGAFEAKKGSVSLDPGVEEPAWKKDKGEAAIGKGTISLLVADDGLVTGTLSGALGDAKVAGWVEEGRMTGTITPEPNAEPSMSGTFSLKAEGDVLKGELFASSGDAKLVRTAPLEIKRD